MFEARLKIDAEYWSELETVLNEVKTNGESLIMQRRDKAWKRSLRRRKWSRDWAKRQRDEENARFVAIGNGSCRARGHRPFPTKQFIRDVAAILPVLVVEARVRGVQSASLVSS